MLSTPFDAAVDIPFDVTVNIPFDTRAYLLKLNILFDPYRHMLVLGGLRCYCSTLIVILQVNVF